MGRSFWPRDIAWLDVLHAGRPAWRLDDGLHVRFLIAQLGAIPEGHVWLAPAQEQAPDLRYSSEDSVEPQDILGGQGLVQSGVVCPARL